MAQFLWNLEVNILKIPKDPFLKICLAVSLNLFEKSELLESHIFIYTLTYSIIPGWV